MRWNIPDQTEEKDLKTSKTSRHKNCQGRKNIWSGDQVSFECGARKKKKKIRLSAELGARKLSREGAAVWQSTLKKNEDTNATYPPETCTQKHPSKGLDERLTRCIETGRGKRTQRKRKGRESTLSFPRKRKLTSTEKKEYKIKFIREASWAQLI